MNWTSKKPTVAGWMRNTVQVRKAIERFRHKTVKGEGENACWLFTGFIDKHGYGLCRPGFAALGDTLEITKVLPDRVYAKREDGSEAFFALTCGASRLEKVEAQ